MRIGHDQRRRTIIQTKAAEREGGYVLVMFALLLIPLLLFVGFSVDVGSWYNRASDMQKAADAASLAGVVWLPDEAKARQVALETAKKNGFDNADPNIDVIVAKSTKVPNRLQVSIRDRRVGSFIYSNIGGGDLDMSRGAFAEFVTPVPLGSPENYFGGTTQMSGGGVPSDKVQNLWGNIHGPATNNYNGDEFAPRCRGNQDCATNSNSGHRPSGYLYTIDVPENVSNLSMDIYDAGYYPRSSESDPRNPGDYSYTSNGTAAERKTRWTFYNTDSTPLIVTDNPTARAAGICRTGTPGDWELGQDHNKGIAATTFENTWRTICAIDGTVPPGKYLLRVEVPDKGGFANRYALRVTASSATKPRIAAYGDMSMYNNIASGTANFFLAEVGPEHQGKQFEVSLYDPGEVAGNGYIDLMRPDGTVATNCRLVTTNEVSGGASAQNANIANCTVQTAISGAAQFNGERVTLRIAIPTNYTCTRGRIDNQGCWWKIRYRINAQANDTTTWSARILGDPVHLIEE